MPKKALIGVSIVFAILAFILISNNLKKNSSQVSGTQTSNNIDAGSTVKASANIDKSFTFHAVNQNKGLKEIKFNIVSVDRKDQIRVQGEEKLAPKDHDFLLVRIEIENKLTERLALAPSDLIRLEDEGAKLFAPDYHNGNVILEPISIKKDLMSFVVKKDVKHFTFQIGELDKEKQKVEVNF